MNALPRPTLARLARFLPKGAHHRAIAGALLLTTSLLLVSKAIGLAKEVLIAMRFGTGVVADVYALAFLLALWPVGLWASVIGGVLVPTYIKFQADAPRELDVLRAELLGIGALGGLLVGVLVWLALEIAVGSGALGLSLGAAALMSRTAIAFGAMSALGVVNAILNSQLLATRSRHLGLMDGVPSLGVILALLVLPIQDPWPLVGGTLAGFAAQTVLLVLAQPPAWRRTLPRFQFGSGVWPEVWRGLSVLLMSQALISVTGVIDQLSVTGLGTSANAVLGYANRIILLVTSLISLAVSRAILPVLAQHRGDRAQAWRTTMTWSAGLFLVASSAAAVVAVFAPTVVKLLFERGSFSAADTQSVAEALRFGVLQIPFFCAGIVLVQYVSATQAYKLFLWGNAVNLLVKLAANALLIPDFGVSGAMLSTAVMYGVSMAFLWIMGRPRRGAGNATGMVN